MHTVAPLPVLGFSELLHRLRSARATASDDFEHRHGPTSCQVRQDKVMRHGLIPHFHCLLRELICRKEPPAGPETIHSRAVADIAARGAAPVGVSEDLVQVLPKAHLEASSAEDPPTPPPNQTPLLQRTGAPRLLVHRLLAAEVAGRAALAWLLVQFRALQVRLSRIWPPPRRRGLELLQAFEVLQSVVLPVLPLLCPQLCEVRPDAPRALPRRRRRGGGTLPPG